MSEYRFSRRALLRTLGASAGFLPLLDARPGFSAVPDVPKRLITIVWPNGVIQKPTNGHPGFWPTGGETDFVIDNGETSVLKPLIPYQKDILIMGGLELKAGLDDDLLGGHAAFPYLLTGIKASTCSFPINPDGYKKTGGGPSVDQVIADELQKRSKVNFPTLQLVVNKPDRGAGNYVNFRGPSIGGEPNGPSQEYDPVKLFDKLFAGGMLDDGSLVRLRAERASVFDRVGKRLESLGKRLGTDDRMKIEAHIASVRELEMQLQASSGGCMTPPRPPAGSIDYAKGLESYNKDIPAIQNLQMDLVVSAMKCDLNRISTLVWSNSHNDFYVFFWLGDEFVKGARDDDQAGFGGDYRHHHEIAHNQDNDATHTRWKNLVDQWFVSQFARLIKTLADTPEGGKRMLDNTVVLFANCMGNGPNHSVQNLPWVMAGSCGGYFKTGRYLKNVGGQAGKLAPHNGVLVSLCNAMGVPRESFGDPAYGGELSLLRG